MQVQEKAMRWQSAKQVAPSCGANFKQRNSKNIDG